MELSNGNSLPRGDIENMRKTALQSLKRKNEEDSGASPADSVENGPKKVALGDDDATGIYKRAMLAIVQLNSQYDVPFELVLEQTDVKPAFLVSLYKACGLPIPHLKGQHTSLPVVTDQMSNSTPNSEEVSLSRKIPENASQPPLSGKGSLSSAEPSREARSGTEPVSSPFTSGTPSDRQAKFGSNRMPAPIYLHDSDDSSDEDTERMRHHISAKKKPHKMKSGLSQLKAKEAEIKRISEAIARLEAAKNGAGSVKEAQAEVDEAIGTASALPFQANPPDVEVPGRKVVRTNLSEPSPSDLQSHVEQPNSPEDIRSQLESELMKYDLTVEEEAIKAAQILLADRKRSYENLKEKREAILQRLKTLESEAPKPSEPAAKVAPSGETRAQSDDVYDLKNSTKDGHALVSELTGPAKPATDTEDAGDVHESSSREESSQDDEYEPSLSSVGINTPVANTPDINQQYNSTPVLSAVENPEANGIVLPKSSVVTESLADPQSNASKGPNQVTPLKSSLSQSEPANVLDTKDTKLDELFYQSPLRYFKSFKLSPEYLSNVGPEGYRSLTFSNKIDPKSSFCVFETMGGICNDDSCHCQHMESIKLSDDDILLQMISIAEGNTEEEVSKYKMGLKKRLMDAQIGGKASSFEDFISAILSYRREVAGPDRVIDFHTQ